MRPFLTAVSRFQYWLDQQDDIIFSEKLILRYSEEFLYPLSGKNGDCILSFDSFFPEISHVKKFCLLAHGVELKEIRDVNALLREFEKKHKKKKAGVFTWEQLENYVARKMAFQFCD